MTLPKEPKALVGNAADGEQVDRAGKKVELVREQYLRSLRQIMSTPGGRLFINEQIARSNLFGAIFVGSTNETMFNLGYAEMGKKLIADIEDAAPEFYSVMVAEAKAREASA